MKITLPISKKDIEIKEFITRKIDREYNSIVWDNAKVNEKWEAQFTLWWMGKAQDYLVWEMTWMSQKEIDELSTTDFDLIIEKIENIKIPSSKTSK